MAASRELTPLQRKNYAEGVRSRICGDGANVVKALSIAMMLTSIALDDKRRLSLQELSEAVADLLTEDERQTLTSLLPLLTPRMRKLGYRRERQERREEIAAMARHLARKRTRAGRMHRVRCVFTPRRAPLRPTRRARVPRTTQRVRANAAQRDGPSEPSPSPDLALGGVL